MEVQPTEMRQVLAFRVFSKGAKNGEREKQPPDRLCKPYHFEDRISGVGDIRERVPRPISPNPIVETTDTHQV